LKERAKCLNRRGRSACHHIALPLSQDEGRQLSRKANESQGLPIVSSEGAEKIKKNRHFSLIAAGANCKIVLALNEMVLVLLLETGWRIETSTSTADG
jgi:hypothetical protein